MRVERIIPVQVNRRIGQAMQNYAMLSHGDCVLVAVSGGVDSLVLAWLLQMWLRKAPISYSLRVVNIDMGFRGAEDDANPVDEISRQLHRFGIPLLVAPAGKTAAELAPASAAMDPGQGRSEQTCFLCARQRRHQLFELARDYGCNKIAFGHHKDDLIETLFLNMFYSGNLSTMVPKQKLFDGRLALIRPLAYVEKHEIKAIAEKLGIVPVDNFCPLAGTTRREHVRRLLQNMYAQDPAIKASIFAAMANVREGYLL